MTDRFSLGRVLADTGSALAKRWPLLLLTIAAVQVGLSLLLDLAGGVTEATVGELIGPLSFVNFGASAVGIILAALLVAAKPAAVDEGLGPIAAIRRNFELTRRRRWLMTGLVFGSGLVVGMVQFAAILMKPAMTDRWGEMGGRLFGYAAAPVVALSIVFLTCVYRELRRLAGPDERETARVFD